MAVASRDAVEDDVRHQSGPAFEQLLAQRVEPDLIAQPLTQRPVQAKRPGDFCHPREHVHRDRNGAEQANRIAVLPVPAIPLAHGRGTSLRLGEEAVPPFGDRPLAEGIQRKRIRRARQPEHEDVEEQ